MSATAAAELARLQRCNQDWVMRVVTQRGLTTRQTAHLVQRLLAAAPEQWPELLDQSVMAAATPAKGARARRTPAEQLVGDAWAIRGLAVRLHARLVERSLVSLGMPACAVVRGELAELRSCLAALTITLETRLSVEGGCDATA